MGVDNEVSSNGDRWVVDPETGELYEVESSSTYYLPPLDISSITSRELYDSIVKVRLKKFMKLKISPILLDVIVDRGLSIPAMSVLCLLGQKIGYNNMVYTSVKELVDGSGYIRQTVSNAIGELKDNGMLREVDNKLKEKESRLFLVNPLYFFLGYYPNRDKLLNEWMLGH
jgi:DNA-binding MarR family transcriptional regulator